MSETAADFVHLHVHTEYSTLDGINRIDTMPTYVKETLGQHAVAITDHGNVSGSYKHFKACVKADVKPIIGMEAYYTVGDRTAKEKDEDGNNYYHMVLLAKNGRGLKNLFKLSTFAYTEGMYHKPRIDDDLLAQYSQDIIATSACLGSRASQLILGDRAKEAAALIEHHAQIFKDNFFIELQLHQDEEQQKVNQALLQIAREQKLPLLLSNDAHYTHQQDKRIHEIALCIQTNDTLDNPKRFSFGDIDVHLAHHDWMAQQAQAQGIPYEAISNSLHIADTIDARSYFADRRNKYPRYEGLPEGLTSWDALERLAKHRLVQKMGKLPPQEYRDRIDSELAVIKQMGFYDYLLIVWEYLEGARSEGVWIGPGRGSAAGSLVAFALDITQVDPIKYGLIFERWLNIGRSATPLIFNDEMIAQVEALKPNEHSASCVSGCTSEHRHSH